MFRRKLGDGAVDLGTDLALLHFFGWKGVRLRHRFGSGIDLSELDGVVKFRPGSLDLFFSNPIDSHVHHNAIEPGIKGGFPPEAPDRFPSLQEAILSKIPG